MLVQSRTCVLASLPRLAVAVMLSGACGIASAQEGTPREPDEDWEPPRTSFGVPDFQGVWTNATITPLEREESLGNKRAFTPEEAQEREERVARMTEAASQPSDPDAGPPPEGGNIGGYNRFWMDPGERVAYVDGEFRTSLIYEPENGQIPYTETGRRKLQAAMEERSQFDHPEQRPMNERCLIGFGSTGGPPMIPVLYNNMYRIVQTPGYAMIVVEMNHDARIIRIDEDWHETDYEKWLGDSVGYYEDDTLVVKTTNFNPDGVMRVATRHRLYVGEDSVVTERFTRVSEDAIRYHWTVENPELYEQPWSGAYRFSATDERMFEYACHEGNYALPGALAGARREEQQEQQQQEQEEED